VTRSVARRAEKQHAHIYLILLTQPLSLDHSISILRPLCPLPLASSCTRALSS
jgi:hypothetical protein